MAEISADFRPARMEEIYEIARRLHWKIVQEEEKPFFYHFVYTGEDLPRMQAGKDWSFLVLNEKGTASLMLERIQCTAAIYECERVTTQSGLTENAFVMRSFMNKVKILDKTLRKELHSCAPEIVLRRK